MFSRKLFSSKTRSNSSDNGRPVLAHRTSATSNRSDSVDSGTTVVQNDASCSVTPSSTISKEISQDSALNPLGLFMLHDPYGPRKVDIIFIHGLGGTSRMTWCKDKIDTLFWPKEWLAKDADVHHTARIFSYGYNSKLKSSRQSSVFGISELANDLLYDLVFSKGHDGTGLGLGEVPIIFVAHSMGGLVFKKAYLEARLDTRYSHIANSTKGIAFLSTPHRGSDLVIYLKRLLSIYVTTNQKQYVSELDENSFLLKDLNDQFRHVAPDLEIFSFFEALKTNIAGIASTVIVDGNSAKLGYPGEICRSLNTDHPGMSKFASASDPNYIAVLGALKSLISSCETTGQDENGDEMHKLREFFNITDSIEHDIEFFESRRTDGTCMSVLEKEEVATWISDQSTSKLVWMYGRPARGKSVIASCLVRHLQQRSKMTQFFFFRASDASKRILSTFLTSMAFQIAQSVATFRQSLIAIAESGWKWHETEWKTVWKRLFENTLLTTNLKNTLYWVIDGVDECNMPCQLVELMSTINQSSTPIRILLLSRWGDEISTVFEKAKLKASYTSICIDKDDTDIELFVNEELRYTNWGDEIIRRVKDEILQNAADNFLWVSLVLEEMKGCHTEEDVNERLHELPHGMHSLYQRMEFAILNLKRPSDKTLSHRLLCWVVYSRQTLTMKEMSKILEPEFGRILDLSRTLGRLCGQFITVEADRSIGLVHHTAREYLWQSSLLSSPSNDSNHAEIFTECISTFLAKGFKAELASSSPSDFKYRATAWWHHLNASRRGNHADQQLDLLCQFFSAQSVLHWINLLAELKQLKVLIDASQALHVFVKAKRKADAAKDPISRRFHDLENIEAWSKDLLKILGKFGGYLLQDPASVYYCLAPFCPTTSQVHKTFGEKGTSGLRVNGKSEEWDDCLARFSVGSECRATIIASSNAHVALVDTDGKTTIWDSRSFEQISVLNHKEPISAIAFNSKGDRIATYGSQTTKLWTVRMGVIEYSFQNLKNIQATSIAFVENDNMLVLITSQQYFCKAVLERRGSEWDGTSLRNVSDRVDGVDTSLQAALHGVFQTAATSLALSPDGQKVAAAYRAYPVTVARTASGGMLHKISRPSHSQSHPAVKASPFAMDVAWHPESDEIMGIFGDGFTFRFNIMDATYQEWPRATNQDPANIHCSDDGAVYAICNKNGSIELYDYQSCTLIYQLNSDSPLNAFSFSSDGRNFYDVRGSYCAVWEPNALIRLSAIEEDPSPSQSLDDGTLKSSVVSEGVADKVAPVVLMEWIDRCSLVAFASADGSLGLLDVETMEKQHISQTSVRISPDHLKWNRDGTLLCYSELGRRITIATMKNKTAVQFEKFSTSKITKDITQTLFLDGSDGTLLLVASASGGFLFSLQPVTLKASYAVARGSHARTWAEHPKSKDRVLSIDIDGVVVHNLSDLRKIGEWTFSHKLATPVERAYNRDEPVDQKVSKAQITLLQSYVIVQITREADIRTLKPQFIVFNVTDLELSNDTLATLTLPGAIYSTMESPLNIMPNGSLIYLDSSFWICSWNIKGGNVTRHFFIPRDWLSVQSIGLLQITQSGSILCPRNGGLYIVDSNIGNSW